MKVQIKRRTTPLLPSSQNFDIKEGDKHMKRDRQSERERDRVREE